MPSALFSPIRLADLELANRIVVSPMCQYSADDGVASDWHINHLGMLANSGAGLVIVEMTDVERRRADAIVESRENRMQLMVALARRDAGGDKGLNLAVSADKGAMYLQREGAQLREMPVKIGLEATVGSVPDEVRLAAPLGKRVVVRVVDSSYAWEIPSWVWKQRGQTPPADRRIEGALGPIAILLDGGAVIYSRPDTGPLAAAAYVLPGGVRAEAADLLAIRENLAAGMPAYFY